ncbi:MAG: ABC transporter permease [Myxococcales bacterium]|nr:ABC transporter permease [Myxococcales bacterium]
MSRIFGAVWIAFLLAFGALKRSPLRASLTALGILIGVAAVTIVVALGEGATQEISGRIDSMGENALIVMPAETLRSGVRDERAVGILTEGDAEALAAEAPAVERAAPLLFSSAQVAWRDANSPTTIVGSTRAFFDIRRWKVSSGTLWPVSSETLGEKVCVIGVGVRNNLFGSEDPVGQTLRIGRHPFRIVGLLDEKGQGPFGNDQDDVVVMPVATLRAKLLPTRPGQVGRILLQGTTPDSAAEVERQAEAILRQRHGLTEGAENDFRVRSQEDFRRRQEGILGTLRTLLLSIALVSLVVGGIGVMNIMLVSVTERTREIGIRMAIGAREIDIMFQFLVEAVVLSLLGGAVGALLAVLAVRSIANALGWQMGVSTDALMVALGVSTTIGVTFGFFPARRAARLDPIHALRRE